MIVSTNSESSNFLDPDNDSPVTINQSQTSISHDTSDLNISTSYGDDDVAVMEERSPSAASPQNQLLSHSIRYKQLLDASTSYINAWILHPRSHNKALGYLINGTNCLLQANSAGSEVNLQKLAEGFSSMFGINETGPVFNTSPIPASTRGPGSGRTETKRLTSIHGRELSKRHKTYDSCNVKPPKIGRSGSPAKCSFCLDVGHNRTSCPIRKTFGRDYSQNPDNIMHQLTLPCPKQPKVLYSSANVPIPFPQIPTETC